MPEILSCTLSSLDFKILLKTNSPAVLAYYQDVADRAIPSYYCYKAISRDYDWEFTVMVAPETSLYIDPLARQTFFYFNESALWRNDLEILLVYHFSHLYLSVDNVLAYAVGLRSPEGRGLMLVGGFASGKSITSLKLLKDGYRYLGNDRLLIGRLQGRPTMFGGTKPIRLRPETIRLYFPEYLYLLKTFGKDRFIAVAADLCQKKTEATPIDLVVRVKVVPVNDEYCTCRRLVDVESSFSEVALYQPLSFFYDPLQLVLVTTKSVYQPLNQKEVSTRVLALARDIYKQSQTFEIFGNLDWVTAKIKAIMEGEL